MLNSNNETSIIELLKAENNELLKYKKRLDFIESISQEAIAVFDENLKCIDINNQTTKIFGYTREEVQGMNGSDFTAPEYRELALKNAVENNLEPYEVKMRRKDGSKFWAVVQGSSVEYAGRLVRVVTCRDITEQKALQDKNKLINAEYETIFDNSQVGIVLLTDKRVIKRANQKMVEIFGYDNVSDFIGDTIEKFHLSHENYEEFGEYYNSTLLTGATVETEYQFKNCRGNPVWISINGRVVDKSNPPSLEKGVVWVFENIDSRKKAEKKLKEAYSELEVIFNNAMMGIMLLRGGRVIHRVNQVLANILGYDSPDEMKNMPVRNIHLNDAAYNEFGERFYNALATQEVHAVDYEVRRKDGAPIWVAVSGKAVDSSIPADLDHGVIWSVMDIAKRKNAEEQLVELARRDGLTGVFNRRYFYELSQIELEIHKRYNRRFSFIGLDIDYFKVINDTYGHAVGDRSLAAFAKVVGHAIRSTDIFGRLGGEEFGICLLEVDLDMAIEIAEKVRKKVMASFTVASEGIPAMTVSMGVVMIGSAETLESAVKRADVLLYAAKEEGRNLVKY